MKKDFHSLQIKAVFSTLLCVSSLLFSACDGGAAATVTNGSNSPPPFVPPPPTPVTLSSISPTHGTTVGGTSVTITGTGFAPGLSVSIGGVSCSSVQISSTTSLTCTAGIHAAGIVSAVVTPSSGSAATLSSSFTYVTPAAPAPTLSSISPASGSVAGGTTLTLTGTNFASGASVFVSGQACGSVSVVSSTQVTCVTASHLKGAGSTVVQNSDGQSATLAASYTYTGTATYTLLKSAIFAPKCGACHSGPTPQNGFDPTVYSDLFSLNVVTAGNAAGSQLYQVVVGTSTMFPQMPYLGVPLSTTETGSIADWINAGAANN